MDVNALVARLTQACLQLEAIRIVLGPAAVVSVPTPDSPRLMLITPALLCCG